MSQRFLLVILLVFTMVNLSQGQKRKSKQIKESPIVSLDNSLYAKMKWREIGPFRGGRSAAVTGVPGNPNLFYFGAAGGGVWRTQDGGRSWANISDGFFGGSVGSIAVSESDNNVMYVGGGEVTVRGNVSHGYGVWKSENAGESWESMGLEDTRHIVRIRVHPDNSDVVYAAVLGDLYKDSDARGVYKSIDGGKSWKKTLFSNASSGAVDLCFDPNNPRILYASTWNVRRTPYSLSSGGDGSALWKSTDSGETWTNISSNKGLPSSTLGIIGVTVSPVNSKRVWAIIEAEEGGVFRSEDGGLNWKRVNASRSLRQRAWYYSKIYADPQDEDVVYVMNVSYHKSTDGGANFKSNNAPHGDHHDLWIDPEVPSRMVIADDGGAQVTYDGGMTWTTYHNQPTAQFYRVTTDDHFPYRIYAAQQDNSTIRISHRTNGYSIGEDDWESTAGCECGHIAIDPNDNDIVYGGCYDGFLERLDHKKDMSRNITVWPDNPMGHGAEDMKYRFQWNFPLFFSPHDSKKLYTASNHLHVSTDEGQSWKLISPDLTRNDPSKLGSSGGPITKDNTSVEYYCTIFAAVESPAKEGLIWAGSDDGLIHITQDGGENWENITPSILPEWSMINSIEAHPTDPATLYVAATRYKLGDFKPYLLKTNDYGKTWTMINNGIDSDHFTRVIRMDPDREGLLYAGTESGIYVSFDDGENWESFQMNLPQVPITDMVMKDKNLIVATQGRSIWLIDDLSIIHQAKLGQDLNENILFKPMDAYRMRGGQGRQSLTSGQNHKGGISVNYFLGNISDSALVKLRFLEKDGKLIKEFSSDASDKGSKLKYEKGANVFNWNLRYEGGKDFEGMILWWASLQGPRAVPGTYSVELEVDGEVQKQTFELINDPRVEASQEELEYQFEFLNEILAEVSAAHEAIIDIRSVRKQLNDYKSRIKDKEAMEEIVGQIDAINEKMKSIEENLYQTKNRSRQDPLNFPIKLTNKLAHLNALVGGSDFAPTDQAVAVKKELSAAIQLELKAFESLKMEDIKALNTAIDAANIDAIIVD
jgi:photosystem II stability/assembly factor-like uncharacterized protein